MKETKVLIAFLLSTVQIFGQLNPLNNFQFSNWYSYGSLCPANNCFSLDWEEPDSSIMDTLIEHSIYCDSELRRFQDYIGVGYG